VPYGEGPTPVEESSADGGGPVPVWLLRDWGWQEISMREMWRDERYRGIKG